MPNESDKRVPRILQQQPQRESDPQQQRSGATDFQSHRQGQDESKVEGEGSYSATRDIEQAEREGRSHSKGEH